MKTSDALEMQIDTNTVADISNALKQLSESKKKVNCNKKATILKLKKQIVELRAKGTTWKEILQVLKDYNLNVTLTYLRKCIVESQNTTKEKQKIQKKENKIATHVQMPGRNRIRPDTIDL